ncbi:MAG: ATP-binding protein [Pseudomonadota bacterium]
MRDTAILPTRAIEEFVNVVNDWLDYLLPGAIVWGNFRTGKTQAIRYLLENIDELLGSPIPAFLFSPWDAEQQQVTESRFYKEMLHMLGYELADSGVGGVKRRRTIDCMVERVRARDEHRLLLFVDEAQWLTRKHLRFLMDLHNQLKLADVRLITILVGQPELLAIKDGLRSSRQGHLVGRFMTCTHRFDGVLDSVDIDRMFTSLDSGSEYPTGSGVSFTEYFVPKAFQSGWRMKDQASQFWRVLLAVCEREGLPKIEELPMQAISAVIRALLRDLSEMDESSLELTSGHTEEVIYRVALLQIKDHLIQT